MNQLEQDNDLEDDLFTQDSSQRIAPFLDRYFKKYFKIYEPFLPFYAFQHSNNLMIIGITKTHPIVSSTNSIKNISFEPIGADSCKTFVKGKKKKGGIKIQVNKNIANITMSDDTVYEIKSIIDGYIIEINENLFNNPQYLKLYPESRGFIAIVSPLGYKKQLNDQLIDQVEYNKLCHF